MLNIESIRFGRLIKTDIQQFYLDDFTGSHFELIYVGISHIKAK